MIGVAIVCFLLGVWMGVLIGGIATSAKAGDAAMEMAEAGPPPLLSDPMQPHPRGLLPPAPLPSGKLYSDGDRNLISVGPDKSAS